MCHVFMGDFYDCGEGSVSKDSCFITNDRGLICRGAVRTMVEDININTWMMELISCLIVFFIDVYRCSLCNVTCNVLNAMSVSHHGEWK